MIAFFLNDHGEAAVGSASVLREALLGPENAGSPAIFLRQRMSWRQGFQTALGGLPCYTVGFPRGWPFDRWLSVLQVAWLFRRHGVRLAHVHWSGIDHWGLAPYFLLRPGFPYVLTFHAFNERRLKRSGLLEPGRLRRLVEGASRISAVSLALKEAVAEFLPQVRDRIQVVPNGVEPAAEDAGPPPAGVPDRFILSAGIFSFEKGSDLLLLAFFDLWRDGTVRTPLVLCGQDQPKGQLSRLVAALKLQGAVILLPDCPHEVVLTLMKRCLFFVSATREEAFGIAILEAMACGKAVAAPNVGGIPEYLSHESNGLLFRPGDVEALKEAVATLAGDEALREELGRRAAGTAAEYSWSRPRDAYRRIREEALSGCTAS